jgi:hypothetical protein
MIIHALKWSVLIPLKHRRLVLMIHLFAPIAFLNKPMALVIVLPDKSDLMEAHIVTTNWHLE